MGLTVSKMVEDLKLEVIIEGSPDQEVSEGDITRPGLQFAGYFDYFANNRIQIIGKVEWSYLDTLTPELKLERLSKYFEFSMPCIILSRGLEPHNELLNFARDRGIWVLRSQRITTRMVNKIINYFDRELADKTTRHGVLVDVYGVGIMITGESGIGKSETALELITRGHRLVSDDAVDIKCIDRILYGSSPYITSGMMEVRGMGIIDVRALYGLSSILEEKTIDMVIHLEHWQEGKSYERLGLDTHTIDILNVPVKYINLPVMPGRNIAVIIEAAAANHRYKVMSDCSPIDTITKRIEEQMNKKAVEG